MRHFSIVNQLDHFMASFSVGYSKEMDEYVVSFQLEHSAERQTMSVDKFPEFIKTIPGEIGEQIRAEFAKLDWAEVKEAAIKLRKENEKDRNYILVSEADREDDQAYIAARKYLDNHRNFVHEFRAMLIDEYSNAMAGDIAARHDLDLDPAKNYQIALKMVQILLRSIRR